MPLHDWTRVEAGIFHGFHLAWLGALRTQLNNGLLPPDYYADAEQVVQPWEADLLVLREQPDLFTPNNGSGGTSTLSIEPTTRLQLAVNDSPQPKFNRLVIRHVSRDRIIGFIEIVSPRNKDRLESVVSFVSKAVDALRTGVHVLIVDILPPTRFDPQGMCSAVFEELSRNPWEPSEPCRLPIPADEPLTFGSFQSGHPIRAFVEPCRVGADLPELPLFLGGGGHVRLPFAASYQTAWEGTPRRWRDVIAPPAE